jgi:hypothetical protein
MTITTRKTKPKKAAQKPGPKPDTLKLEGNWRDAMKKSLGKKKPASGWPK